MKIIRIYNIKKSKVKCFFDVEVIPGLLIKGFRLCAGERGNFVSGPSYKKEDGEYQNIAWIRQPASNSLLIAIESLYKEQEEGAYNIVNLDEGRGNYISENQTVNIKKNKEEGLSDLPF